MKDKKLTIDSDTHALLKEMALKMDRPLKNASKRIIEAGIEYIIKHGDVTSADSFRPEVVIPDNGIIDF